MKKLATLCALAILYICMPQASIAQKNKTIITDETLTHSKPDRDLNSELPTPPFPVENIGLNDNKPKLSPKVFPNPSSGQFTLSLNQHSQIIDVTISDMAGNFILSQKIKPSFQKQEVTMDLTHLKSGVYLARIDKDVVRVMIQ